MQFYSLEFVLRETKAIPGKSEESSYFDIERGCRNRGIVKQTQFVKIFLFRNLYYSGNNVVGVEGIAKQTYFVNNFLCINLNYSGNYNVNILHKKI